MRRASAAAFSLVCLTLLSACGGGDPSSASLASDDAKASYGIGLNLGGQLRPAEGRLDNQAFMRGVLDAMAGRDPAIPPEQIQAALQAFSTSIQQAQSAKMEADGAANREAGAAYLAENGAKPGVVTTDSGLQYEVLTQGTGPKPTIDDQVSLHYHGTLIDGTVFDSSVERGQPAEFAVGRLIDGFTEALLLMNVGSKYRVVIPSDLAYGPNGSGDVIGPDATLIFEIELLSIVS